MIKYPLHRYPFFLFVCFLFIQCKNNSNTATDLLINQPTDLATPEDMVWVPGKTFWLGAKADDAFALDREQPGREVTVDGFFIDATEVTNAQFKKFVAATNYITVAERPINWEEMKLLLPEGTPKPADSILQPGCLVFNRQTGKVDNLDDYSQWWNWEVGANWRQPNGPGSSLEGKDNFPVVHIAYEDALAYCKWANRALPTEAQWESAAQGKHTNFVFTWGNNKGVLDQFANTWQGVFPETNSAIDGHEFIAPVKSYPPNSIGIYDMLGNVWEMTADYFDVNHLKNSINNPARNPKGSSKTYNPDNPYEVQIIVKGGSFLCNASYCASYRISAKMPMALDTSLEHTGFRTIATVEMLKK